MSATTATSATPMPFACAEGDIHTISLFVNNKPGVLVRVALVFSRRAYNIESLVVSPADGRVLGVEEIEETE